MKIGRELDAIEIQTDYKKSGIPCCFDPFRKKLIPTTKEEIVRQKVAAYCRDVLNVPEDLIFTEDALRHWGSKSKDRADIIIGYREYNDIRCLAIIEYKSPDIHLSSQTYTQCSRYIEELEGKYIFITNSDDIFAWHIGNNETNELSKLPTYQEMLNEELILYEPEPESYYRQSLDEIAAMSDDEFLDTGYIGEDTPKYLWKHIVNLGNCFDDNSHKINKLRRKTFKISEDIGIIDLNYSDASGGGFGSGEYRSLLITDISGNSKIIGFSVMPTGKHRMIRSTVIPRGKAF